MPRPLYNLVGLAQRPNDPVLVVEGEKTAVAASEVIEDYVAITWPGGCEAVSRADWTPLKGRDVIVWPDADPEGEKAAREVGDHASRAGAASVRIVRLPKGLPKGWDLADTIPGVLDLAALLADAEDVNATRLAGLNLINAADLLATEFREPKWAVPGLLPEGVAILAGRPKCGKSWLALGAAVAVASGSEALGNIECAEGDVLYLALEDTARRLQGRLMAVLQGEPAPGRLTITTEWRKRWPR